MKFSILVPVYNVEKYLEQCVESLLDQTFDGEYEIILVNDGSTDSSGIICDKYAQIHPERVRVIHKKNEGLVSARQAGIEIANGEFCLFIDSDDYAEPDMLESIDQSNRKTSDADIFIFNLNRFCQKDKTPRKSLIDGDESVFWGEAKKIIYETLISGTLVTSLCVKAVKTEILKNDTTDYSQYYNKNMAEDWFRSIHLLTEAESIVYINKHLYNYRVNEQSISRSLSPETIEKKNILYVYDRFMEYLPKWDMDTEEYRQKLNARWLNEVMFTFSQYYEAASSSKDKKAILNYDWSSMLPAECLCNASPFENKSYRKLFESLCKKEFLKIKLFFAKRRVYGICKKAKARIKTIWVKPKK